MTYVFAAYTIIWSFLFAYLVTLGRRQTNMAKELDVLAEQVQIIASNKK